MSHQEPALTAAEVSQLLSCTKRTLLRLIERGELKAFKVGRDYRIWPEEVRRFTGEEEVVA